MKTVGKVYINGASRGNPGPAGIGIVISDSEGRVLREHYEYLGPNFTSNQAEYMALIKALELCSLIFPKGTIHVFSDSELLIKQLMGLYRVRSPNLKRLFREVKRKEKLFNKVVYHHISRENNVKADRLASKAIDENVNKQPQTS